MNLLGSNTPDGERVLFVLGEKSSTLMTGSFPLEPPPFTAAFLNGDICSLHHVTEGRKKKKNNTRDINSNGLVLTYG